MEQLEEHAQNEAHEQEDDDEFLEPLAEPVKKKITFTKNEKKKIKKIKCKYCNKVFMYEYMRFQANPKCKECKKNGITKRLDKQVIAEKKCNFCKKMFPIYPTMKKKVKGKFFWDVKCTYCKARHGAPKGPLPRQDRKYFECDICGKCFKARHFIYLHMDVHRPQEEFTCRVCNKKSKNRGVLRVHLRSHFQTFVCHLCGFQTSTPNTYKSHMDGHELDPNQIRDPPKSTTTKKKSTDKEGEFPCKYCGYVYHTKSALNAHEFRRHESTGALDFKCQTCNEVFPTFMEHRNHTFTHSNLPLLFCTHPGCTQFFNRLKKLNAHIRNVHANNDISCEKCGKKFKLKGSLQKHLRNNRCVPVRVRKSILGVATLLRTKKKGKDPDQLQQEAAIAKQQYREMGGILDLDSEIPEPSTSEKKAKKKKSKKVSESESEIDSIPDYIDQMPLSIAQHNFEVNIKEEEYNEELPIVQIKEEPEEMHFVGADVEVKEEPADDEHISLPLHFLTPDLEPQIILERIDDTEVFLNYQKRESSPDEMLEEEDFEIYKTEKKIKRLKRLTLSNRLSSKAGNKYVCDVCDMKFRKKKEFCKHFATHEKMTVKCKLCPEEFPKRAALRMHLSEQHGLKYNDALRCIDDPYICDMCGKHYPTFGAISAHLKFTHKTNLDYQCHICPAKFKCAMYVKRHIEDVHERIYRFCCKFCGKFFRRNHQVKEHERLHNDPQPCAICGKLVRNMKTHIRHHTLASQKKTEYQVCPECGKNVAVYNMKHHIARIHQKQPIPGKIYGCNICSETFLRVDDLRRHKIIDHSTKPIKHCPHPGCDAVFPRTKQLTTHIRNSHREVKLKCKHCLKLFQSDSGFRKHLTKKHGDEFTKLPEPNQHNCATPHPLPIELQQPPAIEPQQQRINENVFS